MIIDLFDTIPTPGHDLLIKVTKLRQFCFRIDCFVLEIERAISP